MSPVPITIEQMAKHLHRSDTGYTDPAWDLLEKHEQGRHIQNHYRKLANAALMLVYPVVAHGD